MMKRKTLQAGILTIMMAGMMLLFAGSAHADYDTTAPKLNSITIKTPIVEKPGIAEVEFDITEDETGVSEFCFFFNRKGMIGSTSIQYDQYAANGDPLIFTGKNTFLVKIPSSAPSDQWYISGVLLIDAAGNRMEYNTWYARFDDDVVFHPVELRLKDFFAMEVDEADTVPVSGYLTIKDEFDVAFESSTSNPKVLSDIGAMSVGSTGMIRFSTSNSIAKKEMFDGIKGQDKTLVFSNDGIQWMINGKDITNETKNIDLKITSAIVDAKDYGGEGSVAVLTFVDNGVLPGKARIRLKADYLLGNGFNLYYKDGSAISLESTDGRGFQDGDSKWVEFYVTHNSTFLLSKSKLTKSNEEPPQEPETPTTESESELPSDTAPEVPAAPTAKKDKDQPIKISVKPESVKTKVKKNKVTVSWKQIKKTKKNSKDVSKIKSIQVQYATNSSFTKNVVTKTIKKDKTSYTLKLKKNTTYYIRVRYVGKDCASRWSGKKKVKIKG